MNYLASRRPFCLEFGDWLPLTFYPRSRLPSGFCCLLHDKEPKAVIEALVLC
jgi:hypothetical protein